MPFNMDAYGDSGGLLTGNGMGTIPTAGTGPLGKTMMAPDGGVFNPTLNQVDTSIFNPTQNPIDYSSMNGGPTGVAPLTLPQIPNAPGVPGNPTGINNVPGGVIQSPPNTASYSDSAVPQNLVNPLLTSPANNLVVPGAPGPSSGATAFAQPGTSTAQAQAGTGTAIAQGGAANVNNSISIPALAATGINQVDPNNVGQLLSQILNIPNTVGNNPTSSSPVNATPQVATSSIPTTNTMPNPVPLPPGVSPNFPANGIDSNTTNPATLDLGSLLGIKQNTALPGQLDDIYGKGFGSTYASLLQAGGGFNPDINNALINQLRPQETRAFDNIRQTMANAGLSPNGSPFALAAGDFWSQAANNENAVVANNFNNSVNRTYDLFGQGLEAAQVSQANKMGPLQWLSALSPLLGPLISGLASKIPSINISSTTQSQGGAGTSTGTGGTSTSTGTGGTTTSTSTSQGGQGGRGGTATSQSNPTVSPTITQSPQIDPSMNPTFQNVPSFNVSPTFSPQINPTFSPSVDPSFQISNSPYIAPQIDPTIHIDPTISPNIAPSINPSILGTISPTFQNTPSFNNNPSVQVNPTLTNTSSNDAHIAPIISPSISPTMINSMGGGGLPSGFPGQPSPIPPPPGPGSIPISSFPFPPIPSPGGTSTGSTIGFPGGQQVPAAPGVAPPIPPGGMPTAPPNWWQPAPYEGSPTTGGIPYDPYIGPGGGFLPTGTGPNGTYNPGDLGPGSYPGLPGVDNIGNYGPIDPYQPSPTQAGMNPDGGGGNFNSAAYYDGGDPFGLSNDPWGPGGFYGDWSGGGGGGGGGSTFDSLASMFGEEYY